MQQQTPAQGFNLQIPPDVKPVYADDAVLLNAMKFNVDKDKKNKVTKIPKLEVLFYDRSTRTVVSRVVFDVLTAKALGKILLADADKLLKDMKTDKIPKNVQPKVNPIDGPPSTSHQHDYIG